LEFGKNKIKSELCKIQENTIETLEQILEKTRKTHDKLRNRVDKLEYQLYDNKQNRGNGDAI
jgi:BMFP domain-containing protein YqiC